MKKWSKESIGQLLNKPFLDLLYQAQSVHREHFSPNHIQLSALLSIKTGKCPEDCAYCPQSVRHDTGLKEEALLDHDTILSAAKKAKAAGAQRFCMGAAWRRLHDRDVEKIGHTIQAVKKEGLETCVTLGMLTASQAKSLKSYGLDYYNHNIDTSPEHYSKIITTRTFEDRLDTLEHVRSANIKVCCGGILGMDEKIEDRVGMLAVLANLEPAPESVPLNLLVKIAGTPLENAEDLEHLDFVRIVAVARIIMPTSDIRLSAGRESMSDITQAMCFMAGANSIFYGEELLTTTNPGVDKDTILLDKLGIQAVHAG